MQQHVTQRTTPPTSTSPGAVLVPTMIGLIAVVGISASLSLMFPTIYGVALQGLGPDTKFGAAGLVMDIFRGRDHAARPRQGDGPVPEGGRH